MYYLSRTYRVATPSGLGLQLRGMATLKESEYFSSFLLTSYIGTKKLIFRIFNPILASERLKSVSSISKITKSMKMIAAAKVNKAQVIMQAAREYAEVTTDLLSKAEIEKPENVTKRLYVVASSDRGLCGSIHSGLTRYLRTELPKIPDSKIVVIGQKSRSQLLRLAPDKIVLSFDQVAKVQPTWMEAAALASEILKMTDDIDIVTFLYNKFKSVIAFEVKDWIIPKFKKDLVDYPKLNAYDYEAESFDDFRQFLLSNVLFAAISEGYASEMSARRTAMENATNNAEEMIRTLTLSYNRSRQAAITNELIDIITGASAL